MTSYQSTMSSFIHFVLLIVCLIGYSQCQEAAPAQQQQPTVNQAVQDLGVAAQNGATQMIENNGAVIQQATAAGHQMASNMVQPLQYTDESQQKSLLHSAASGSVKFAREVTGHTGGLLRGIVSSVGEFGKGLLSSGRSLMGRSSDRQGKSSIVQPASFIPANTNAQQQQIAQQVDPQQNLQPVPAVPQPEAAVVAQEAIPVVAASQQVPAETPAPVEEAKPEETKTEDKPEEKAEEEKKEEEKSEEKKGEEDEAKPEEEKAEEKGEEKKEEAEEKKDETEEKKEEEEKDAEKKEEGEEEKKEEEKEEGEEKKDEGEGEEKKEEEKDDEKKGEIEEKKDGEKDEEKKEEGDEKKEEKKDEEEKSKSE